MGARFLFPGSRRIADNIWIGLLVLLILWLAKAVLNIISWL